MFLKKLKAFLNRNYFLTTTAKCSFKHFDVQCPHTFFKLKHFVFIPKHSFLNDSYNKQTFIMTLPCLLRGVFMMRFVYKDHAHQL